MSLAVIIKALFPSFFIKNIERYRPSSVLPSTLYKSSPSTLPLSLLNILKLPDNTSSTS